MTDARSPTATSGVLPTSCLLYRALPESDEMLLAHTLLNHAAIVGKSE